MAYPCVPFAVLLPIDPSKNSPFLRHSMLSLSELTLLIFRSVVSNLCQISYCTFTKARSFGRQLAKCFSKIQTWFGPSMNVPNKEICTLSRQSYSESDSVFRQIKPVLSRVSSSKFESLNPSVLPCQSLRLWI